MRLSDFNFELPERLIAKYPLSERSASRLLSLNCNSGELSHGYFEGIVDLIQATDLIIFNNTKVIPARMFGSKASGGKVEILIERLNSETEATAHIKASNKTKPGTELFIGDYKLVVTGRSEEFYILKSEQPLSEIMSEHGHMPLPPYIDRADDASDSERYQTVYAEREGAVAAPTAGLHFTEELLAKIIDKGASTAYVTLHVGAGTFQPVRVDNVKEHVMHSEWYEISEETVAKINETKARGGRIIAVGTTSVRTLESAAMSIGETGELSATSGDTDIFIYPGYQFQLVDVMITNFHLPESTLMMLVSAFAGSENIRQAYQEAIDNEYRFFSYGDAMLLTRKDN